jgi:hypothetical protein
MTTLLKGATKSPPGLGKPSFFSSFSSSFFFRVLFSKTDQAERVRSSIFLYFSFFFFLNVLPSLALSFVLVLELFLLLLLLAHFFKTKRTLSKCHQQGPKTTKL